MYDRLHDLPEITLDTLSEAFGIPDKSIRNLRKNPECIDGRTITGAKKKSKRAITDEEKQHVLELLNLDEVKRMSIRAAYYHIMDETNYSFGMSLRSVYKIAKEAGYRDRSGTKRTTKGSHTKKSHEVTAPNQVWVFDYFSIPLKGYLNKYVHFLTVMDLYSRRILNDDISLSQTSDDLIRIFTKLFKEYGITPETGLIAHCDNGSAMKSEATKQFMEKHGVKMTFSRPHVSDDNAFAEVANKTLQYSQRIMFKAASTVEAVSVNVMEGVKNYNNTPHSALNNVTPNARFEGRDAELMRLENRKMKMKAAKAKHPERWPHKKVAKYEPVGKTVMYFGQIKQSDSCETVPDL